MPASPLVTGTIASPARLALISDTHIFADGRRAIPPQVLDLFARAEPDRIIHLGDVVAQHVIDELNLIAPVIAVRGNNDHGAFGDSLPLRVDLTIGARTVRVVHGHGGGNRSARRVATSLATGADAVLYGHSHVPRLELVGEAIVLNPGSPTDRRWHPHFGVAFLEVSDQSLSPTLIPFDDPATLASTKITWTFPR